MLQSPSKRTHTQLENVLCGELHGKAPFKATGFTKSWRVSPMSSLVRSKVPNALDNGSTMEPWTISEVDFEGLNVLSNSNAWSIQHLEDHKKPG